MARVALSCDFVSHLVLYTGKKLFCSYVAGLSAGIGGWGEKWDLSLFLLRNCVDLVRAVFTVFLSFSS